MPALQIVDLNNAKTDVDHIADIANSEELTATDRLGRTKRTLAGIDAEAESRMDANDAEALSRMDVIDTAAETQRENIQDAADLVLAGAGYAVPVAYTSGLSMTLQTQTVTYDGAVYAPIQSELPFTTSGTFETAKFRLIQGVSGADLAAPTGSALVGFAASGAGAGSRTLEAKSREIVSLTDFHANGVSGAMVTGDGVTDCAGGYAAALATGAIVFEPPGTFLINSKIAIPSGAIMRGAGVEATTVRSGVIGDSLFYTTASAAGFIHMSDKTIDGNGLTGASGNGHAINFIDPTIDGGSHSPQFCTLERLYIRDFKGNDVVPGSASTFEACGIVQADGLQNVYRDVIVQNCGHGFYFYRAQNTKLINCAADSVMKAALIVYDCENVSAEKCDFVDAADGVPSTNYPVSFGSATVISYQNENFVLSDCKLKNTNGGCLIRSILSDGDVIEKCWLRADSLTDNVHKGIYAERSAGLRIIYNVFSPANSGFTLRKYQQIELYTTQTNEPWSATIAYNYFGDVPGMTIEYNIKVNGNATTRRFAGLKLTDNQFGWRNGSSSASVVEADILFENCVALVCEAGGNVHYAGTNVTRTVGVKRASTATLTNCKVGPSHFQASGGTITANYDGLVEAGTVSADKGDASVTLTVGVSEQTAVWNTALTTGRSVSLSTVGAYNGAKFRIVRTANSTGAFNLSVGTGPLKNLAAGQWCEVEFDGSAWVLTAFGSL
jgi:hypothetical protein